MGSLRASSLHGLLFVYRTNMWNSKKINKVLLISIHIEEEKQKYKSFKSI